MTAELPRLFFWRKPPDEASIVNEYQTRIAVLSLKLEHPHRKFLDRASRQEVPKDKLPELLNGKAKYLGMEEGTEDLAMLYAGSSGENAWVSVGFENKRITYLLSDGKKPACVLQERRSPGEWGGTVSLGEVDLGEVRELISFGERVVQH